MYSRGILARPWLSPDDDSVYVLHGYHSRRVGSRGLAREAVRRLARQSSLRQRQSAAAAERRASLFSIKQFESRIHIVSDRLGVILCWQHGTWACQPHKPQSGSGVMHAVALRLGGSTAANPSRSRKSSPITINLWTTPWTAAWHATCWGTSGLTSSLERVLHARDKSEVAAVAICNKLVKRVPKTLATVLALFPAQSAVLRLLDARQAPCQEADNSITPLPAG